MKKIGMNMIAHPYWLLWGGAHGFSLHLWLILKSHTRCARGNPSLRRCVAGREASGMGLVGSHRPSLGTAFQGIHSDPLAQMEIPLDTRRSESCLCVGRCGGRSRSWHLGSSRRRSSMSLTQG